MLTFFKRLFSRGQFDVRGSRTVGAEQDGKCLISSDGLTLWQFSGCQTNGASGKLQKALEENTLGIKKHGERSSGSVPNLVEVIKQPDDSTLNDGCSHHRNDNQAFSNKSFKEDIIEGANEPNGHCSHHTSSRAAITPGNHTLWVQILMSLVHFPVGLLTLLTSAWNNCLGSSGDLRESNKEQCVQVKAFRHFAIPRDLDYPSDILGYQKLVGEVLSKMCEMSDDKAFELAKQEMFEILHFKYSRRLKVWLDLVLLEENKNIQGFLLQNILNALVIENDHGDLTETFVANIKSSPEPNLLPQLHSNMSLVFQMIVNGQVKLLDLVLEISNKDVIYKVLNDGSNITSCSKSLPSLKLPLFWAVWKGDSQLVKTLIEHGAEMWKQDINGNAFHVISMLSSKNGELACHMFEVLLDFIPLWLRHSKDLSGLAHLPQETQSLVAKVLLLKSENIEGLTPLKLAGKVGHSKLVKNFLNVPEVYRFQKREKMLNSEFLYDFSEIDPLLSFTCGVPSLLEIFVLENDDKHLPCFEIPPIHGLAQQKQSIHRPALALVCLRHLIFAIFINTFAYVHVILKASTPPALPMHTLPNHSYINHGGNPSEFEFSDFILMAYVTLNLIYLGCICYSFWTVGHRLRIPPKKYIHMWNYLQAGFLLALIVASFSYFMVRLFATSYKSVIYALSIILLLSWVQVLQCTRLLPHTGFFSLMLGRVLFSDVVRFVLVIFILVLAFSSAACAFFYTVDRGVDVSNYLNLGNVMLAYIKLAFGIADFGHLMSVSHPFTYLLYLFFLLLANVLVFNLLIAAMSSSYAMIGAKHEVLCDKVILQDMIITERILPFYLLKQATNIYERRRIIIHFDEETSLERLVYLMPVPCDTQGNISAATTA